MAFMQVMKEIMEDVHSDRLSIGLRDTISGLYNLDDDLRAHSLNIFLDEKSKTENIIRNMSMRGAVELGRSLQKKARQEYDNNITKSFALWLVGAWVEGQSRESKVSQEVYHQINDLAESIEIELNTKDNIEKNNNENSDYLAQEVEFSNLIEAAESGILSSQIDLGLLFLNGDGVSVNYTEAYKWFDKAVSQGSDVAELYIGQMHEFGEGVQKSSTKALKFYLKSSEKGNANAQEIIGEFYLNGICVEKDYEKARNWFLKAADKGDAQAQYQLGKIYKYGVGVQSNSEEAFSWFLPAARNGHAQAQEELAELYYYGDGVAEDQYEAFKWYESAAKKKLPLSEAMVGFAYINGGLVDKNDVLGLQWLLRAAQTIDEAYLQFEIAMLYMAGGSHQETKSAFYWFKRAAENNDLQAMYQVGYMCLNGIGVNKDLMEAKKWLTKSADVGHPYAQLELGKLYSTTLNDLIISEKYLSMAAESELVAEAEYEIGLIYQNNHDKGKFDYDGAYIFFKRSAEKGFSKAEERVGFFFENGLSVDKDKKEALCWYEKSAKKGNDEANKAILRMASEKKKDIFSIVINISLFVAIGLSIIFIDK